MALGRHRPGKENVSRAPYWGAPARCPPPGAARRASTCFLWEPSGVPAPPLLVRLAAYERSSAVRALALAPLVYLSCVSRLRGVRRRVSVAPLGRWRVREKERVDRLGVKKKAAQICATFFEITLLPRKCHARQMSLFLVIRTKCCLLCEEVQEQ